MNRKFAANILVLALCVSALTGCQSTDILDEVPETFSLELKSEDENTYFTADHAKVDYSGTDYFPVYEVSDLELDQDRIDEVTQALFGDAPVYFEFAYHTHTKAEILKEIEFMKESAAKGNMNPCNYNVVLGKEEFDIYKYIEELEAEYETALEEYTLKPVIPSVNLDVDSEEYNIPVKEKEFYRSNFCGYAVIDEDEVYYYELLGAGINNIKAFRDHRQGLKRDYVDETWLDCDSELLVNPGDEWINSRLYWWGIEEENVEKEAGISLEEAKKQANALIEKLGMEELEINQWYPAVLDSIFAGEYMVGYEFHYTRNLDGTPILYFPMGTNSISNEDVTVIISKEGLEYIEISDPCVISEVKEKAPQILSFDTIVKKLKEALPDQYVNNIVGVDIQDTENYENHVELEQAVLSYMKVKDEETGKYLLIPVWDFLGRQWDNSYSYTGFLKPGEEETVYCGSIRLPHSFLTINAADGTVVDRDFLH